MYKDVREQIAEKLGYKSFDDVMEQWDKIRKMIADGNKSSYPRDWFESLIWELYQQPLQVPCKCITPEAEDGSVCSSCNGTGYVPMMMRKKCPEHDKYIKPLTLECADCNGTGYITQPVTQDMIEYKIIQGTTSEDGNETYFHKEFDLKPEYKKEGWEIWTMTKE